MKMVVFSPCFVTVFMDSNSELHMVSELIYFYLDCHDAAITPGIVKGLRNWGFKIGSDKLSTTASLLKVPSRILLRQAKKLGTQT